MFKGSSNSDHESQLKLIKNKYGPRRYWKEGQRGHCTFFLAFKVQG